MAAAGDDGGGGATGSNKQPQQAAAVMVMKTKSASSLRWAILVCASLLMLSNYYVYDVPASLCVCVCVGFWGGLGSWSWADECRLVLTPMYNKHNSKDLIRQNMGKDKADFEVRTPTRVCVNVCVSVGF